MGVSALSSSSATSLLFLVTAWTVIMVVIPQTSYLIAVRAVDAEDPDSPHVPFLAEYMSHKPVSADRFPRYRSPRIRFADGFEAGIVPLTILILKTALAFCFALWAINRSDVELTGS
jgi:hypothetical protein